MSKVAYGVTFFGLSLLVLLAILACDKKEPAADSAGADGSPNKITAAVAMPELPPDSLVTLSRLTEAGREIGLETNLWYNLMPGPDDESAPELNIQIRLMTDEATTVPGDFVLDYVWVSMGGGTWGVAPEAEQIGSGATRERMFRGGPIYDAEEGARTEELPRATVTVSISDKAGRHHYLRKTDQPVERVY